LFVSLARKIQARKEFWFMSDISSIGSGGLGSVGPVNRTSLHPAQANGTPRLEASFESAAVDRVEVSESARWLDVLRRLPEVRLDRIAQLRQAIDDGAYDSDDKLDVALDRLLTEEL
jgi:anti-sigma28 factor (negative regulator of flagellin synthesis)